MVRIAIRFGLLSEIPNPLVSSSEDESSLKTGVK